jgi:3-oxoadipate enol-lactonase
MEKLFAKTDFGKMGYWTGGQGKNLVLLHSLGVSAESWRPVMDALAGSFKVFALDLLGHGDSDKPPKHFLIEDYAQSIFQFMDHLKIDRAILCGTSVGALIAVEMAAFDPKRVERMILVGCPVRNPWERMERLVFSALTLDAQGLPRPITLSELGASFAHPTEELLQWFNQQRAKAGVWVKNLIIAIALYDAFPKFARVKCPTLVIYGNKDVLVGKERELVQRIKGARSVILPDAGHVAQMDQPQAFLKEVSQFLV